MNNLNHQNKKDFVTDQFLRVTSARTLSEILNRRNEELRYKLNTSKGLKENKGWEIVRQNLDKKIRLTVQIVLSDMADCNDEAAILLS